MSYALRPLRPKQSLRTRNYLRNKLRVWLRTAVVASLGLATSVALTASLHAQDVNNSTTKSFGTNAVEHADGDYNNLSTGTLNFNGPSGAAAWSSSTLVITNAGTVNLFRANLGIDGNVSNTGIFQIASNGGIIQVGGNFTSSGSAAEVQINGGGMELIADPGYFSDFTNSSTAATGVTISGTRYLVADTITNDAGATISNSGRLEGRTEIVNDGTIRSNAATSILKGTITNNGTIEARGSVEGNVTNTASKTFTVTGNLAQTGDLTNAGTLSVSGGNLTGTDELVNSSTITIADGRTVSAAKIENNTGGTITLGSGSVLTGVVLENNAEITVGAGGTVSSTSSTVGDDLTNNATGTITFSGSTGTANLSSGTGKIVNKGTINLNAGTVLVTGNLTDAGTVAIANGATFKTGSANQTIANAITLTGTSSFDTNAFDATASGNITGAGGLTKKGLGNLTLEGTNTFSGASSINAGQLTLKGGAALKDTTALTVDAAGKLRIEDSETIGSLAGAAGSETNMAADLTTGGNDLTTNYAGKIVGAGKLTKQGTGTMTLSGAQANTFSGGLDINGGSLVASTDEQLGTGSVTVGADSTLVINEDTTQSVDRVTVSSDGTLENSGTLTSAHRISNSGNIVNVEATSDINGGITNEDADAVIVNNGTIFGGVTNQAGTVNNSTATSVINGGLLNANAYTVNNTGEINGGVTNYGTLNSNTATSSITGGLINQGNANLRNQVSGAIVNEVGIELSPVLTVAGDLVGNSTVLNKDNAKLHVKDGNFTGITTLTNQSTNAAGVQIDATRTLGANAVVNQFGSTMVNSGTLQSATVIDNSGTITNNVGATVGGGINNAYAGSLVTNNGTINGGITQNHGTVDSLSANSVINGGVTNSGTVNAKNSISGAIVNNAQHSFTDVTLTHTQTNAAGTVTFGSGGAAQTFNLVAASGSAGGAEGNGEKDVIIVFDADSSLVGTSSYDSNSDTITVYVADTVTTTVGDIQTAINNGSGFTASGGNAAGAIDEDGVTNALTGGRDSGTALIRVLADATGAAAQNKLVSVINDNSIAANSAVAAVDSATGNITVRVRGNVDYGDIADAIDDLSSYSASVTSSVGDQVYTTALDTPPTASQLTNGVFNVEGNLAVDNTFINGGHLNLNDGNLTGITTLTNTGVILVQDELELQASTVNNSTGKIDLGYDSMLEADTITNSSKINVNGLGDLVSDGTITNEATGTITFGLGSVDPDDLSELYSDTNTIVNNGLIDVTQGTLLTTGNVSGDGTIAMGEGTRFVTGNNDQTITNQMTIADGGWTEFNTDGKNATVSGAISGDGELVKAGAGNLTLSGNNTFTGPATINGGQLTLDGGSAIDDSVDIEVNSGTLKVSSAETVGSLTTANGTQTVLDATLTTGGNNASTTSSGLIGGAAELVKEGSGTMTLNGSLANTYSGGTTVNDGTLVASTNQQLGTGSVTVGTDGSLVTNNGTTQSVAGLFNEGTVSLGNSATLNTGSSHFNNSGTVNTGIGASIIDTGAVTNSGTLNFAGGTTTFSSGTNAISNTGTINLNAGTALVKGSVSGNGTIAMGNGTTFQSANNNQAIANNMTVTSGGAATFNTAGNNAALSGAVSGNGQFTKVGTGELTLSGNNSFTGPATISGGQLTLQGGQAIANSTSVQLNAGSLKVASAETIGSLTTAVGTQTTLDANLTTGGNNGSTTSSGVIGGVAALTKQGTGTMTLNGLAANTYAGGTNVTAGTLVAATDQQLGSGSVSVSNGATLTTGNNTTQSIAGLANQGTVTLGNNSTLNTGSGNFNNSGTVNVGTNGRIMDVGAISNAGTINFAGGLATLSSGTNSITNTGTINLNAGTVLVKGDLAGNGSINMNNGTTLRSGSANQQIANGIQVNSGTAVIDTNGNDVNLTGAIAGNGTLNKIGVGTLNWVGVNQGNALVNSGVMVTSTQNQVGNVQIANGSGVIFDQSTNGTYAGNVTGEGTLTKTGSGIVTMTGNSSYNGGTNVLAGSLLVGSHGTGQIQSNVNVANGATLGGGGTVVGNVTTQTGGQLSAGNSIGTLNVAGNLNAGGSTVINELNGTTSDLINVSGNANIVGASLNNQFDSTASYNTRMYRVLNATGGVTGQFSNVTNQNAPNDFLISTYYTPTTANLVLTSLADATLAASTSTALLSAGQDYSTTIMNQVNGYQYGGLGMIMQDGLHRAHRNVWFKGVGFFNDISSLQTLPGYTANTGGGILGIDQVFGESTRLGVAGGYTATDLTMRNAAKANADINSARLNIYGAHSIDLLTFSAIGGYAYHDVQSKRNLLGIGTARGDQIQNEASLNFQVTMNPRSDGHSFLPYAGVQWVHLAQNAYMEQGTPGFDILVNKDDVDSLRPYVGMLYQRRYFTDSGLGTTPYLSARYSHETIVNSNLSNLSINGTNFLVSGVRPNRSIVGLGGGMNVQFRDRMDCFLNYNVDLGDRGTNQNAAGGLGFRF